MADFTFNAEQAAASFTPSTGSVMLPPGWHKVVMMKYRREETSVGEQRVITFEKDGTSFDIWYNVFANDQKWASDAQAQIGALAVAAGMSGSISDETMNSQLPGRYVDVKLWHKKGKLKDDGTHFLNHAINDYAKAGEKSGGAPSPGVKEDMPW